MAWTPVFLSKNRFLHTSVWMGHNATPSGEMEMLCSPEVINLSMASVVRLAESWGRGQDGDRTGRSLSELRRGSNHPDNIEVPWRLRSLSSGVGAYRVAGRSIRVRLVRRPRRESGRRAEGLEVGRPPRTGWERPGKPGSIVGAPPAGSACWAADPRPEVRVTGQDGPE